MAEEANNPGLVEWGTQPGTLLTSDACSCMVIRVQLKQVQVSIESHFR